MEDRYQSDSISSASAKSRGFRKAAFRIPTESLTQNDILITRRQIRPKPSRTLTQSPPHCALMKNIVSVKKGEKKC